MVRPNPVVPERAMERPMNDVEFYKVLEHEI